MNFDRFWTGKHNLRFHLLKTAQNLGNLYVKQFKLVHLDGICNNVLLQISVIHKNFSLH